MVLDTLGNISVTAKILSKVNLKQEPGLPSVGYGRTRLLFHLGSGVGGNVRPSACNQRVKTLPVAASNTAKR